MGRHWSADAADQVRSSIKEAIGKITGNTKLEVEGANERAGGKVNSTAAETKNAVPDPVKK